MNLKKQLASFAVVGMLGVAAATSAFAAGVGYVNFDALIQAHKTIRKLRLKCKMPLKKLRMNIRARVQK